MVNTGDTAWILISAALVMLMTPGLALFYGGMVRRKNVLSTIMMSFALLGLVGVLWLLFGYSLGFGPDLGGFIGKLDFLGLRGLGKRGLAGQAGLALFRRWHCCPRKCRHVGISFGSAAATEEGFQGRPSYGT